MNTNEESKVNYTHPELLLVADTVAREKGIDREEVLEAMEQAIQKAGRSKYGHEHDIRAEIDRGSGEIKLARYVEVVEEIENEATQVTLNVAQGKNANDGGGDDKNNANDENNANDDAGNASKNKVASVKNCGKNSESPARIDPQCAMQEGLEVIKIAETLTRLFKGTARSYKEAEGDDSPRSPSRL